MNQKKEWRKEIKMLRRERKLIERDYWERRRDLQWQLITLDKNAKRAAKHIDRRIAILEGRLS